jgi:F-type H+-transporting ATPase subunit b
MKFSFFEREEAAFFRRVRRLVFASALLLSLFAAGTALGSGGGEHEAAPKGWVATDTYRVMNFAVLAAALFFLLRKPAAAALDGRIKGIKEQLSELEAKKKEAETALSEYNRKLATMEAEAEKIVAEYIRQGNEAKARILEEAASAADKLEEQAKRNIEHEFSRAKVQLQAYILEKAFVKAEELIKSNITSDDQDRLVDEYLKKVAA